MTMFELTVGDLVLLDGDKMVIVLNIEYDETVLVWYKGMEGWIDKFRLSPVLWELLLYYSPTPQAYDELYYSTTLLPYAPTAGLIPKQTRP